MSQIADDLLRAVPRDPEAPHYAEDSFRRKLEEAGRREAQMALPRVRPGALYLYRQEWAEITERSSLTKRQLEVVTLRLEGHTFEQIGDRFGTTKQGAARVFFQGAKKLAKAWVDYPFRGLPSVYEEETTRGIPMGR
ncbi:MAG: hypothetical protein KF857_10415 [Fimbriimonadaceae bacterium]|nr:hypothetical protein [Fimbriimonadaceae bacterium]